MANLKVVVPLLNKRKFPVTDTKDKSNVIGQVKKDFRFESVAEVTNALGNWYQDRDGYFYWGVGVNEIPKPILTSPFIFDSSKVASWSKFNFEISRFWPYTTGKNITVAVLDSGITMHSDLADAIDTIYQRNYYMQNNKCLYNSDIKDIDGHGTHVAGIIAARGKSDILGVAPEARLLPIRIVEKEDMAINTKCLIEAIKYATSLKHVDIINLSLNSDSGDIENEDELKETIQNSINAGKILVAASGNINAPYIKSPAKYENMISVSAVEMAEINSSKESYQLTSGSNYGDNLTTCCPGTRIESCFNSQVGKTEKSGTSMACAYLSGIIALKLQLQKNLNYHQIKAINDISSSVYQTINQGEFSLRVLNPFSFINL